MARLQGWGCMHECAHVTSQCYLLACDAVIGANCAWFHGSWGGWPHALVSACSSAIQLLIAGRCRHQEKWTKVTWTKRTAEIIHYIFQPRHVRLNTLDRMTYVLTKLSPVGRQWGKPRHICTCFEQSCDTMPCSSCILSYLYMWTLLTRLKIICLPVKLIWERH